MVIPRPSDKVLLPNPQPLDLSTFQWFVLTPDRLPKGDSWVYYGITPEHYETLARNMAEILRWVREAKWRLDYYRGEGHLDGRGNEGIGGTSR